MLEIDLGDDDDDDEQQDEEDLLGADEVCADEVVDPASEKAAPKPRPASESEKEETKKEEDGASKPPSSFLRVRSNLASSESECASDNVFSSLPADRKRVEQEALDSEVSALASEVAALKWLARRKEQEWDQILRLLKQTEERHARQGAIIETGSEGRNSRDGKMEIKEGFYVTNEVFRYVFNLCQH